MKIKLSDPKAIKTEHGKLLFHFLLNFMLSKVLSINVLVKFYYKKHYRSFIILVMLTTIILYFILLYNKL